MYIGIHVLHTLPPSSPNSGEDGLPKTVRYGGVQRFRISSQAQKKAVRDVLTAEHPGEYLGLRENVARIIMFALAQDRGLDQPQRDLADLDKVFADHPADIAFFKDVIKKVVGSGAMGFYSKEAIDYMTAVALSADRDESTSAELRKAFMEKITESVTPDIAMTGRMVAADPSLNVHSAVQVGHMIGISQVQVESDMWVCMGDSQAQGSEGMGSVGYISGVGYRTASINTDVLDGNLHGDADMADLATRRFLNAFAVTLPQGRQSAFFQHTLPHHCVVSVSDRPLSLADAFLTTDETDGVARLSEKMESVAASGLVDVEFFSGRLSEAVDAAIAHAREQA